MKQFYLLIALLIGAQGTAFSITERCACSNYLQNTMCNASGFCSWINNTCVDIQCPYVYQTQCTDIDTYYKCQWNTSKNACENKTYTCSDITDQGSCNLMFGFDCIWLSSSSKCVDFTCTGMDIKTCDVFRCSYIGGVCGQPQSVDCSTQTSTNCGLDRPGDGTVCTVNDKNECKSYSILLKDCSDYNDLSRLCSQNCIMDQTTLECRDKKCSDFVSQSDCTYILDVYELSYTPCYWDGKNCTEATDQNIQTFGVVQCVMYTAVHYAWDLDKSTCYQCSSLTPSTQMSTLKGIIDSMSNSEILLVFILSMLLD